MLAAHQQQAPHHQVLRNVTELIFEGGAAAAAGAGACCATTRKSCAATFEHFYVFSVQSQSFFHTFLDAIVRWSKNFNKITSTLLYQKENTLKTSQL